MYLLPVCMADAAVEIRFLIALSRDSNPHFQSILVHEPYLFQFRLCALWHWLGNQPYPCLRTARQYFDSSPRYLRHTCCYSPIPHHPNSQNMTLTWRHAGDVTFEWDPTQSCWLQVLFMSHTLLKTALFLIQLLETSRPPHTYEILVCPPIDWKWSKR